MPRAGRVEGLLPGAEVEQAEAPVAGDGGAHLLVLHHQHLHHHQVHRVLNAGMLIQLGRHGNQGQDVVLGGGTRERGGG